MSVDVIPQEKKAENSLLYAAILCLADSEEESLRPEHRAFFQRTALRLKFGGKLTEAEARKIWRTLRFYDSALDKAGIPFRSIPEPPCPTQAVRLIEIVEGNSVLFHDEGRTAYAVVNAGDHQETHGVRSRDFRLWLQGLFLADQGQTPSSQALTDALQAVEGICIHQRPQFPVFVRLAEWKGNIYLDLANAAWEVVEISPNGWQVSRIAPINFRRTRGMAPLPAPEPGGSITELRDFVNAPDDESWILLVAWLVAALRPTGPYPVAAFTGEQGSAKTTQARLCRAVTDPCIAGMRATPRDERDLAIAAHNSHVLAFDNLSGLSGWLSDALARVATGGGFATRELYSDDEERIFDFVRPVILNGIDDVISRPDLLDRALIFNLPEIREENRKDEKEFWRDFEEVRPRILGALLDAVAEGLRNIDTIKLDRLPRMADFAKWVVACEPALPWEPGAFMKAYSGNRADAVSLALESDCVAVAVKELLEHRELFQGTATELLDELVDYVPEKTAKSRAWPKTPRTLANRLRRAATFLRRTGIEVEFDREPGGNRRRVIRLSKNTIVPTVPIVPTNKEDQLRTDYEIEHAGRKRDARDASGTQGGEVASQLETLTMLA